MKLSWKVAEFDERGALRDEARAEDAKEAGKSCLGRGLEVLYDMIRDSLRSSATS